MDNKSDSHPMVIEDLDFIIAADLKVLSLSGFAIGKLAKKCKLWGHDISVVRIDDSRFKLKVSQEKGYSKVLIISEPVKPGSKGVRYYFQAENKDGDPVRVTRMYWFQGKLLSRHSIDLAYAESRFHNCPARFDTLSDIHYRRKKQARTKHRIQAESAISATYSELAKSASSGKSIEYPKAPRKEALERVKHINGAIKSLRISNREIKGGLDRIKSGEIELSESEMEKLSNSFLNIDGISTPKT